jgi:hypothetical protein
VILGLFDALTKLEYLNFRKNHISSISDKLFNALQNLKSLQLTSNHLRRVPSDYFFRNNASFLLSDTTQRLFKPVQSGRPASGPELHIRVTREQFRIQPQPEEAFPLFEQPGRTG